MPKTRRMAGPSTAVAGIARRAARKEKASYSRKQPPGAPTVSLHLPLIPEREALPETDYECSLTPGALVSKDCTGCTHLRALNTWRSLKELSEESLTFISSTEAHGLTNGD